MKTIASDLDLPSNAGCAAVEWLMASAQQWRAER